MLPRLRIPLLSGLVFAVAVVPACAEAYEAADAPSADASDGDDARPADDAATGETAVDAASFHTVEVTNPVFGVDHPDPDVLRVVGPNGRPTYYLTATVDTGDIDVFTSPDLMSWTKSPNGLFDAAERSVKGKSLAINGREYCSIWAPQLEQLGPSSFLLSFTASRFASAQASCPAYGENGGSYWATASSPLGPFAPPSRTAEPAAFGASPGCAIRDSLPRSRDLVTDDCQGGFCHQMVRLDAHVFRDPKTGRAWAAYSWYTNTPPLVQFEKDNHGEHVHIVELDAADPRYVKCDASTPQIFAANAHDDATRAKLAAYCPRCGEQLAFDKGRQDENVVRDGFSWSVVEGASLVRRGEWVYLFVSGSLFDSAYYTVFFVAAKTVEELSVDNPNRLVGRFLIPSQDQSFGHGTPVLGPDGTTLYFLHHRLQHGPCKATGNCARDIWVSPVEFEDRGDGRGDVWIKPHFPAEDPKVRIAVPD